MGTTKEQYVYVYVPNRTINCETLYQVNAPFGVVDCLSKTDMLTRDCGEVSRRASAIHNELLLYGGK